MNTINLVLDYRGAFYSSTTNRYTLCTMNVEELIAEFRQLDVKANVIGFPDIDLRKPHKNEVFVYQSSEDPGLYYKSYIEDLVYALELAGAFIIPQYRHLRAHHNKVFMECLRDLSQDELLQNLHSHKYGTFEDCARDSHAYPLVVKSAAGAGSSGVRLARDGPELNRVTRKLSWSMTMMDVLREWARCWRWPGYVPHSRYRAKFLCQEFIPDLPFDFKVLIYGNRLYAFRREVRPSDFRASGSGRFTWPRNLPHGLLDFAWRVFRILDVPHASLDIAVVKDKFVVLEMQFLDFGPVGVEKSPHHFVRDHEGWEPVEGPSKLEKVFAEGVVNYWKRKVGNGLISASAASGDSRSLRAQTAVQQSDTDKAVSL